MATAIIDRPGLMVLAGWLAASLILPAAPARGQANAANLNLLISPEQPFVAEPDAARLVMHIHNPTQQTIWLYRRAKGKHPAEETPGGETEAVSTSGGSTVGVRLEPVDAQAARTVADPAKATILEYVQMPKPRLVRLAGGADYQEVTILHLAPATVDGQKPIWGAYRLTLTYGARFSNGDQFQRNLGVQLWQGEVTSNTISLDLRPPLPDAVGIASGTALGKDLQPREGIRVSLSDEQGQVMDQQVTGVDGTFSFEHLPLALYWITGRQVDAEDDTATFRHDELTSNTPHINTQLVFYPEQTDDPRKFIHKPILVRVFDAGREPLGGIAIEAVFSNGDLLDDVKATSEDDGTAMMELLPGRSSVSLRKRGCADQSERFDVAPGQGTDCFRFVFDCEKK